MSERNSFFRFSNNSAYNRRFTYAVSIVPRSDVVRHECPECNAVESDPAGAFDVTVEGGSMYPDVLGCGAYPFLIVSESVISGWQEAGVACFHTFPVGITRVQSKNLRRVTPPNYFRVEIDGRCQIDLAASGLEVVRFCPECHYLVTRPSSIRGFRIAAGSWDGCALFRDEVRYPRVNFCTNLVLELAGKHRWTNFRFEPMEGPFESASKGIDYLSTAFR